MKNLLIAAVFLLLAPLTSRAEYWPMFCKAGSSLNVRVSEDLATEKMARYLVIDFQKLTIAAGQNFENLKPGQCSWPDRALNAGEMPCLLWNLNKDVHTIRVNHEIQADGSVITKVDNWALGPTVKSVKGSTGRNFKVFVQNKGGCLEIRTNENGLPDIVF